MAVRIIDDVNEEERTGLPALNGHAKEQALLPTRSNTTLVPLTPAYIRRNDTNARKVALQRRMVRKRWLRDEHTHHIKVAFNTIYQLSRNRHNFSLYPGTCRRGIRRL